MLYNKMLPFKQYEHSIVYIFTVHLSGEMSVTFESP